MTYTHFVWLRNNKGGFDAQLWSRDISVETAAGGNYRADCPHVKVERLAKKVKLPPEDVNITLDEAKRKYPPPVVSTE